MSHIIKEREHLSLSKIGTKHNKNYYEALDALTRVFKLGYTIKS
jgi:hypothetical protein